MNAPQGSSAWLAERAGHCTASRFKDVLAKVKSGEAANRRNYRLQLVTERLLGAPVESYKNAAMEWGTATEPFAREAYEALTGAWVEQAPFIKHPSIEWCGGSPDGLIDDDGVLEIKCPHQSTVHVETWESRMPLEHLAQCQGVLLVTGRKYVEFVSYDPRMPEHLRLYRERILRNEDYINMLAREIAEFLRGVADMHARLMETRPLLDQLVASIDARSAGSQI